MKQWTFCCVICWCIGGFASNEKILSKLDELLLNRSFSESFKVKDDFKVQFTEESSLGKSNSQTTCITYLTANNVATIDCGKDPQKPNSRETITETTWSSNTGNTARMLMKSIEGYGVKLVLSQPVEVTTILRVNGRETELQAFRLGYSGSGAFGSKLSGHLILSPFAPGRSQILQRFEKNNRPIANVRTWQVEEISRVIE